jgi:hypothetical protein
MSVTLVLTSKMLLKSSFKQTYAFKNAYASSGMISASLEIFVLFICSTNLTCSRLLKFWYCHALQIAMRQFC